MRVWPALILDFPAGIAAAVPSVSLPDLVSAALDGFDVAAVLEQPDGAWQVCFRDEAVRDAAARLLRARHETDGLGVTSLDVPDEDWARRSQAALRPVQVGQVRVTPPWMRDETPAPGSLIVVIEPAMGFGSGHHATTRLCLSALQRIDCRGRRVIDVGTGSGVLAFAASALGARQVLGIDVDADALENARGNVSLNAHLPPVEFLEADFRRVAAGPADVVVANLTGSMLAAGAEALVALVAPGGALVVSGFTPEESLPVLAAFAAWGRAVWRQDEDGWCAAVLRGAVVAGDGTPPGSKARD